MLKISYKNEEYFFSPSANINIDTAACYGNNNIHWQGEGESAIKIIASIDPITADFVVAIKFNGIVHQRDYFITSDGELEAIMMQDSFGYQICLNTAAFFVDKIVFEIYPQYKRYQKILDEQSCTLAYFGEREFSCEDLRYLQTKAQHYLASDIYAEVKLLSEQDTIQYYQNRGEWYLAQQVMTKESDYPYKFVFCEEYGMQNMMPICADCKITNTLRIKQSVRAALGKKICLINLRLINQ